MAEGSAESEHSKSTVVVYGLRERHRAGRLLDSLAEIPCYPSVIFRIDKSGKLFGAVDQLRQPSRIYYVQVINWCDRSKSLPVIGWTLQPQLISRTLQKRALTALTRFNSGLRQRPPMTLEADIKTHAALHATMRHNAS